MNIRITDKELEFTVVDEIPKVEHRQHRKRSTPTSRCVDKFLESGARIVRIGCADTIKVEAMRKRLIMYLSNNGLKDEVGICSRGSDIYMYRKEEDVSS